MSLLLYRNGEEVRGFVNSCPHFSLPLNARPDEFLVIEGRLIMCVWHCAEFRLQDGLCVAGAAQGMSLEIVPVSVRTGCVYLGA